MGVSNLFNIYQHHEGERPGYDYELCKPVVQHHARRVAALFINYGQLHVAQQTEQNEHGGEVKHVGTDAPGNLRRHGVHDVTHQRDRRRDGDCLVDEREVVAYVFLRGGTPVSFMRNTSSRRLANERKSVSRNVISTSHLLGAMSVAKPPASTLNTKPKATMHTSMMAYCLSLVQ